MKWKNRLEELKKLRIKHGKDRSKARPFPDLREGLDKPGLSPTSDRVGFTPILSTKQMKAILGPNFVIEHLHKSGYQVLLKRDMPWLNR